MDPNRKIWNQQQQTLRQALSNRESFQHAMALFMIQHAMVHAEKMSHSGIWSFEDEILDDLSESQMRLTPKDNQHSIAWILWHLSRIEDVTMNILVAGSPQVLLSENWFERMEVGTQSTGNGMSAANIMELSAKINLEVLRSYRLSVGCRTRTIAKQLCPEDLKRKVSPSRLQQIVKEQAVDVENRDLLDYWSNLTVSGLLLMPPTRHNFIHLNEAQRIRQKTTRPARHRD
jgi:hypothetical protein